jgi:hypothetical protein
MARHFANVAQFNCILGTRSLSDRELAALAYVSPTTVGKLSKTKLDGSLPIAKEETLKKIAAALGIEWMQLTAGLVSRDCYRLPDLSGCWTHSVHCEDACQGVVVSSGRNFSYTSQKFHFVGEIQFAKGKCIFGTIRLSDTARFSMGIFFAKLRDERVFVKAVLQSKRDKLHDFRIKARRVS